MQEPVVHSELFDEMIDNVAAAVACLQSSYKSVSEYSNSV